MKPMDRVTYDWVRQSRSVLLDFCGELKPEDFTRQLDGFGWSSVRKTLVHVADCYNGWLGSFVLGRYNSPFTLDDELEHIDLHRVVRRFEVVDALVNDFFDEFDDLLVQPLHRTIPWREPETLTVAPFKLFMHTVTHEFHHKGQIVSMIRHMGYVPPDTDLLRTRE